MNYFENMWQVRCVTNKKPFFIRYILESVKYLKRMSTHVLTYISVNQFRSLLALIAILWYGNHHRNKAINFGIYAQTIGQG